MNIHIYHSKKKFHSFDYLKYKVHTNIVHMNQNMKFKQFLYEPMGLGMFMMMWYPLFNLELDTCQHFNDSKLDKKTSQVCRF
jgi:hypothetical protein